MDPPPQLMMVRLQGHQVVVPSKIVCAELDVNLAQYAGVVDRSGRFSYLLLEPGTPAAVESHYQLHYGTELQQRDGVYEEQPYAVQRPWSCFQFVPNRSRAVLFCQARSNKILYTVLPRTGTSQAPVCLFGSHSGEVTCLAAGRQGTWLVSGSAVGALKLWHITGGEQLDLKEDAHPAGVTAITFLEPAMVVSAGGDGSVRVWEITGNCLLARQNISAGASPIGALAAHMPVDIMQGDFLASSSALPWRPPPYQQPPHAAQHTDTILIAAGSRDGNLMVWSNQGVGEDTWQLCSTAHQARDSPITGLSFSPDGNVLAVAAGSELGNAWVYNTSSWQCLRLSGALPAAPVACQFCDWVDITAEPQLLLCPAVEGPAAIQAIPLAPLGLAGIDAECELPRELLPRPSQPAPDFPGPSSTTGPQAAAHPLQAAETLAAPQAGSSQLAQQPQPMSAEPPRADGQPDDHGHMARHLSASFVDQPAAARPQDLDAAPPSPRQLSDVTVKQANAQPPAPTSKQHQPHKPRSTQPAPRPATKPAQAGPAPIRLTDGPTGERPTALIVPHLHSTLHLAKQLEQLRTQEFDARAALAAPDAKQQSLICAAAGADLPAGASKYSDLAPLEEPEQQASAPRRLPKQLHPAWLASRAAKPAMGDLWREEAQCVQIADTPPLAYHVAFSRQAIAEAALRIL
ncbi:hypothetical protein WJX72_010354 [[Myrmecia] bisecta]|uniref:Uncharacterized protein n=1 Tax=[Myrmecia] bisecta TaxID=41462 RepID=A0AAW1P9B5_9CHLO